MKKATESEIGQTTPKYKENLKCELTDENDLSEGSALLELESQSRDSNDAVVLEGTELQNLKSELKVLGNEIEV